MDIKVICVCGAGTMGRGIAQVAAQSGFTTILYELNSSVLDQARLQLSEILSSLESKGKITSQEKASCWNRLSFTSNILDCKADLFIEAIIETTVIKATLFNQLAEFNSSSAIFATNTSSLSVKNIAEKVNGPERLIGMHFFNPAPLMKLVEIVSTSYTNEEVRAAVHKIALQMGKTAVNCKDSPGFIVNRVARPFYIESLRLVEEGYADPSTMDLLLESSGFRMGPFKLMDLIGNDINYAVSCSVYEQMGNPLRLKPSYIQENKVKEGKLGKKTGEGYYKYNKE